MTKQANISSIKKTAVHNLTETAKRLGLEDAVLAGLAEPKEKIEIDIHPILTGNKKVSVKVFIVRHQDALGPAKGGIRMTPDVTLDDVTAITSRYDPVRHS